jgi:hypothetical protein
MSKPSNEHPGLTQFLADEVRDRSYVDMLLARAEAAGRGQPVPEASGNAYNVSFGRQRIVIEHHWLKNWPPVHLPREDFIVALQQWRAKLAHPEPGPGQKP